MTTREEIVQQADLLGYIYRGEKREEYLKQEFKVLAERAAKKEELEVEHAAIAKKEEAERAAKLELEKMRLETEMKMLQTKIQAGILEEIASSYSSIFSDRPGTVLIEEHRIELTSSTPVRQRPYPVPYAMRQTLRDELRKMEYLKIIRKSSSPYSSPVVVVKKKYGSNCVCIDYRRLNKITTFDPQPMTPPADVFQGMERTSTSRN
ncbi:retrovirus-related Pol polyprotein from transposon opus [Elysia marginata]|uniref:Retrovirus-related Pol polyprotein from transposon opus n=1 Tax=Elysia marginata TaxID=1093978 RepID=A0AAV4I321_9GAST|nr:retrovirus-related Pol polyprotein from transposon opus [Elysia marginata]